MPRRKINLEDPDDAQSVVGYIEAKAQQSQSNGFSTLLNDESKPIILDPILRQCGAGSRFEITTYAQKVASACHIRGQVAQKQCNNCQQGRGPFVACVQLSGYEDLTKGCCSNCQFDVNTSKRHSPNGLCDFATSVKPEAFFCKCTDSMFIRSSSPISHCSNQPTAFRWPRTHWIST